MFRKERVLGYFLICILIVSAIFLISATSSDAVPLSFLLGTPFPTGASTTTPNWQALPPYNLLWPLWSPVLSPTDPVTGLPSPLVSTLNNNTILPVQPALFWDPARQYPFFLYNIPLIWGGGLTYFDAFYGLNPWPPSYLTDPITGLPSPISLTSGFATLSPTAILPEFVFTGNLLYSEQYGIPITDLLTAGDIWGVLPLSGLLPI
ncbi:hypothetical protein JXL19_00255 [bacterium]|nr:hypothetical protein [bacterium]